MQGTRIEEIEINTGQYAEANNTKDIKFEIERIKYASKTASKLGIEVAGRPWPHRVKSTGYTDRRD